MTYIEADRSNLLFCTKSTHFYEDDDDEVYVVVIPTCDSSADNCAAVTGYTWGQ